jgi:adenine-specific DNA-methyltransferase
VDTDCDGSNFVVRQVFFCGGDSGEFDKWEKDPNRRRKNPSNATPKKPSK